MQRLALRCDVADAPPATVMNATGLRWFAQAFVLSNGDCNPPWDGGRARTGGVDQQTITTVHTNGGDSGNKLESFCSSAGGLATAYQKVINACSLKAIDIDLEADAYSNGTVQQRTADAWAIMPFDFGGAGLNIGTLTQRAAQGLKTALKNVYGYGNDHETVTTADFRTILGYAQAHHLARLTCWPANRDRTCPGAYPNDDTCSGVSQSNGQFTGVFARHTG